MFNNGYTPVEYCHTNYFKMSRIMVKKLVVLLFLFSQVFASSSSTISSMKQSQETPKSHSMKLRSRTVKASPLSVTEMTSSSSSSAVKMTSLKHLPKPDLDLDKDFDPFFEFDMNESTEHAQTGPAKIEPEPLDIIKGVDEGDFTKLVSGIQTTSPSFQVILDSLIENPSAVNAFNILQILFRMNSSQLDSMISFMLSMECPHILAALLVFAKDLVCINNLPMLKRMAELGVPLKKSVCGAYLTHYAAITGSFPLMSYLIDFVGIPVDELSPETGQSALQIALALGKFEMAIYLIVLGSKAGLFDAAVIAVRNNDSFLISAILESNNDLSQFGFVEGGFNLLTYAIHCRSMAVFNILLTLGKVNSLVSDAMGRTIFNMTIPESSPVAEQFRERIQKEHQLISAYLMADF